jgi:hypothetical protein
MFLAFKLVPTAPRILDDEYSNLVPTGQEVGEQGLKLRF